ncbi:MAG: alpha/beta fold hydrolase [Planctomycetota bacterium]
MKKWLFRITIAGFVLLNTSAAFHGYRFTHFADTEEAKTQANQLSFAEKLGVLFFGISNPRPVNQSLPQADFQTDTIPSGEEQLETWEIRADSAKGTVLLFHGYSGEKSSMLERAALIRELGYHTILVDFRGSGGSSGTTTTIGYRESQDVRAVVDELIAQGREQIYLMGTSMGAAAILKALSEDAAGVKGAIIECPFGSLLQTAKNRFERLGVPPFPAAHLLVFWGGIENGFWGFSLEPAEYSKEVRVPTLLMYGELDGRVKRLETDEIYANLAGEKDLLLFPQADHGNYLQVNEAKWVEGVSAFLEAR